MSSLVSRESALKILSSVKIDTGGAISKHEISLEDKDDGDTYIRATIPVWSHNDSVVRGVLQLLTVCYNAGGVVYFRDNAAIVDFYQSVCDPD